MSETKIEIFYVQDTYSMLFSHVSSYAGFCTFSLGIAKGFLHLHLQGYLAVTKLYTCSWPK